MTELQAVAVLDEAHVGDIHGALGTIRHHDTGPRTHVWARLKTLLAIIGPGLIVMVGDNDAGGFATYAQAGQNYGYTLLWTLALLIPVLYVNQEMVLRLGAVSGVGHARLILERFGRFWGAFSVIDLFLLNALTIITEFVGIDLALRYLGLPEKPGVALSAALVTIAVGTGSFRRFERLALTLCVGSLALVPLYFWVGPPLGEVARHFVIPGLPHGGLTSDLMLLIIGIVGTTVAPWQLFFQQSYVIDKRITPRFIRYERADLWLGIGIVIIGAVAIVAVCAYAFGGRPEAGAFADVGATALGLEHVAGRVAGVLFAVALIVSAMLGAAAVSLSSAYALGDVFSVRHSLHRKPWEARAFYLVYAGLVGCSAALVLVPNMPLGLLTVAVQALAGVLLPSATVFLLLLCNDRAVLGPWVNGRMMNLFTSVIIAALVVLSLVLTAATVFPAITGGQIVTILAVGGVLALAAALIALRGMTGGAAAVGPRETWRMKPLASLPKLVLTGPIRLWLGTLRGYLILAAGLVLVRMVQLALGG